MSRPQTIALHRHPSEGYQETPVNPLPGLPVLQELTNCGLAPKKCPFCVYRCFSGDEAFKCHLVANHITFTSTYRTWSGQHHLHVPRPVLQNWKLGARACCTTINKVEFVYLKIWNEVLGYCYHACTFCDIEQSAAVEIENHLVECHLPLKIIVLDHIRRGTDVVD